MKLHPYCVKILSALLLAMPALAAPALDGASGHVHQVDVARRCFELLKETEYAPKTDIGQSRFTVNWDERTQVFVTEVLKSFTGFDAPVHAVFQGLTPSNREALAAGKPFEARVVTLYPDARLAEPVTQDGNQVAGMFTPDADPEARRGVIEIAGKLIAVSLRPKNWNICVKRPVAVEDLAQGFWKATLQGTADGDRFMVSRMEVASLPDPRKTDDPKLPRVLVIGDSISMNYHETAKAALAGVANYHRCEGNAFSSAHGVLNSELWLGNFDQPGFQWDVIQFNHGLHDLKQAYDQVTGVFGTYAVSIDDYKVNLEKQIVILKKTGAKLIWCSTTPVPNDNKGPYARRKGAPREFNDAAMEVMRRHPEIVINDLHQAVDGSPLFDEWRKGVDVHFYKAEEQEALGAAVAVAVRKALGLPAVDSTTESE